MPPTIRVTNLRDGEILPHSLALIEGELTDLKTIDASCTVIRTKFLSTTDDNEDDDDDDDDDDQHGNRVVQTEGQTFIGHRPADTIDWPLVRGHFKALVQLRRGPNAIRLQAIVYSNAASSTNLPTTTSDSAPPSNSNSKSSPSLPSSTDFIPDLALNFSTNLDVISSKCTDFNAITLNSTVLSTSSADDRSEVPVHELLLNLSYEPTDVGGRFVRLLYVVCSDDDDDDDKSCGRFQGPPDQPAAKFDFESASRRIVLGARLVQTFVAENIVRMHGLPRRTFQLERDYGACLKLTIDRNVRQARSMSQRDLWDLVRDTLASATSSLDADLGEDTTLRLMKFVAFLSFTRYVPLASTAVSKDRGSMSHEDVVKMTEGHAALGGGGLALLGTGCLHTWAEDLSEVVYRFRDATRVDTRWLMDDSGYRGTNWANYSNTLGALCHELGHTFGLGHSGDGRGVMGAGFGDIHRMFVLVEDQQEYHEDVVTAYGRRVPSDSGRAFFDYASAIWLSYHKWFNRASQPGNSGRGPELKNTSEVRARHGLRAVVMMDGDVVVGRWQFARGFGVSTFRLPSLVESGDNIRLSSRLYDDASDTSNQLDSSDCERNLTVKAIDTFGNIMETTVLTRSNGNFEFSA